MKIPDTSVQALHEAMERFDNELRNTAEWEKWQEDAAFKYAIEKDGKRYPVKKLISIATGMPVGQFSGGDQANSYIEGYGFKALEINSGVSGIKKSLDLILAQYQKVSHEEAFGSSSSMWPTFKSLQQALKLLGRCDHRKSPCPKYGRYWKDQPGQHERLRVVVSLGNVTQTVAERSLRDHIRKMQVDSPESFVEVTSPTITFKKQAQWWFDEMRAGRIVSRKKRTPIKPATLAGYQAAVNWMNETIGDTPLADIKNEVVKQFVIKMRTAELADKTIVNYFQVVKAVFASAVTPEGEQLYPRNWNFHFIGLPVVDEKKQCKPSLTTNEVEEILEKAKGRYMVLFALLAGTGLRIGEALGLKLGEHLSDDFSTIRVRQSVWRGSVQTPKTDNAVREIDIPTSLAAFLKAHIGDRTSGFLFQSESGRPLMQRNILRDGLGKIRRDLKLERGKAFHAFRRFRTAHLRKNRVPWDLQKLWLGHANRDVTDRYAEQLKEDVEWRKEVAENTGLGFELPAVERSVGLLGLPSGKKMKVKKAA